ncbi:MAG: GtrA family protein [Chloroflexota bacterium]
MSRLAPFRRAVTVWPAVYDRPIPPEIATIWRFACVGLSGVVVNGLLLWLLTERFQIFYLVSSALATEAAILSNFALHHRWTFAQHRARSVLLSRLAKFNLVAFGGLAFTVSTLFVLTQFLGLHYLIANLFAVASGSAWNYAASRTWIWSAARDASNAREIRG